MRPRTQAADPAILEVSDLTVAYPGRAFWGGLRHVGAVQDVSFKVGRSKTFALIGESGSGKSTIARAIAGLVRPIGGKILYDATDVTGAVKRRASRVKRKIQIVFQNPDSSLNPRHSVRYILSRPLAMFENLSSEATEKRVSELLEAVRLDPDYAKRRPHELSGGERQRVAIARALAADPELIICDEILSALDVSVQANIIDLLRTLQRDRKLTYILISHDLAVVRWLAHEIGVLYKGQICETGSTDSIFAPPYHPYTEVLLEAVPRIGRFIESAPAKRDAQTAATRLAPVGCPFADRCPRRLGPVCDSTKPPAHVLPGGHTIHCHIAPDELSRQQIDLTAAEAIPSPMQRTAEHQLGRRMS